METTLSMLSLPSLGGAVNATAEKPAAVTHGGARAAGASGHCHLSIPLRSSMLGLSFSSRLATPQRVGAPGGYNVARAMAVVAEPQSPNKKVKPVMLSPEECAVEYNEEPVVVKPYSCLHKLEIAGGTLDILHWKDDRKIRVWTPPGFSRAGVGPSGYPVLFLNDGQNLFGDELTKSWEAGECASSLILNGLLPPFIVVGIDHSGPSRSFDYCPYKPGSGPGNFRMDAASWPGGGAAEYVDSVVDDVVPNIAKLYSTSRDPEMMAFGGSSFGGIVSLVMAMRHPGVFGSMLVESPSLWIANEAFLRTDIANYKGEWPSRVFVAMGTEEFSGVRFDKRPECDSLLVGYAKELAAVLKTCGLGPDRLSLEIDVGATHIERAWASRLPRALLFLLSSFWDPLLARYKDDLYFTTPKNLKAGQPAVLFVNRKKSDVLALKPEVKVHAGFNNWEMEPFARTMSRAEFLPEAWGEDWFLVPFKVPEDAYEMNFALSDGKHLWDNNAGNNFYCRVGAPLPGGVGQPATALIEAARIAAAEPADKAAAKNASRLFFTAPEKLVAGAPATLYFNRKRSATPLSESPNVRMHFGFNAWEVGAGDVDLKPTSLFRAEGVDWWSAQFTVPEDTYEMNMAFHNGCGEWDSNSGHNYMVNVRGVKEKTARIASPRKVASVDSLPHGNGTLHIVKLTQREDAEVRRRSKWQEEKVLRVWTPPGFDRNNVPAGGYPVLYLNDGQNMYEDWLAHQGVSWRVGYIASDLIGNKELPPFVICAIDSAGPMRSLNYLPYKPGTGVGGFRGDCERWPGGGLESYMRRIVEEIVPLMSEHYGVATDPSRVAFGGGSFAGVSALYAAMKYPHVFGTVLAESPSLWIAEAKFLSDMANHNGMLPEKLFLGCGTLEYSATRDHDRPDVDALLLHYYTEAARILGEKGMRGDRLMFQIDEGAGHHELAWQWRFPGALKYLLSSWWNV